MCMNMHLNGQIVLGNIHKSEYKNTLSLEEHNLLGEHMPMPRFID